jgi:long-chain fatty acid transport protein
MPHSTFSFSQATTGNPVTSTQVPKADDGGDYVKAAIVPHQYFSYQLDDRYTLGLGIFVPYGSSANFDDNYAGRYFARSSELKSVNINPSLAIKLNERHRLGFGLSAQYMHATIGKNYNMQALAVGGCARAPACVSGGGLVPVGAVYADVADGEANTRGHAWGYGFNLGYIFEPDPATRLGVAYRSSIRTRFDGSTDFTLPPLPDGNSVLQGIAAAIRTALASADASLNIRTPETFSLSAYHQLQGPWAFMADLTRSRNSRLDAIVINTPTASIPNRALTLTTNWRDTYKTSIGASYEWNERTILRGGLMYDQGVTSDPRFALPTMPDSGRRWLSLGASYRLGKFDSIDMAYSHVWLKRASIARTDDDYVAANGTPGTLYGEFHTKVDLLSLQFNHRF